MLSNPFVLMGLRTPAFAVTIAKVKGVCLVMDALLASYSSVQVTIFIKLAIKLILRRASTSS